MALSGTKFRKVKRVCVVCGKEFEGTEASQSCTPSCRVKLARLKKAGKRPEYILIAKSKGQKIPDLNAPKGLRFKKGEKKSRPPLVIANIDFKAPDEEAYDGKRLASSIMDEMPQMQTSLTVDQKLKLKEELEKEIKFWETRPCQGHPKMWKEKRDVAIDELQAKINALL